MLIRAGAEESVDSIRNALNAFSKKMGELEGRDCTTLRFLQLLPNEQDDSMHRNHESRLVTGRIAGSNTVLGPYRSRTSRFRATTVASNPISGVSKLAIRFAIK
jgi:hypothetical protein